MTAPYDPREVANFILSIAPESNKPTQLILYKVIFFAHGWHIAATGSPLVNEEFEAWEYGPVLRSLWDQFKAFKERPIESLAKKTDIASGQRYDFPVTMEECDRDFVSNIYRSYRHLSAYQLSHMTHELDSPWEKIWHSRGTSARLRLRITNSEIGEYFARRGGAVKVS